MSTDLAIDDFAGFCMAVADRVGVGADAAPGWQVTALADWYERTHGSEPADSEQGRRVIEKAKEGG